jgi:Tol biopolymer transport system component
MIKARRKYFLLPVLLVVLIFFGVSKPLKAQFYNGSNMQFGKNRVQFRDFFWTYYRFDDFDTYFYLNGKNIAIYLSKYADQEIPLMEEKLGTGLSKKIKFVLFNNLTDFKQSNIGIYQENDQMNNVGGTVKIIGSRVMVYFDGNYKHFEREIRSAIAQVLINDMFFGSTFGQQVKSSIFGSLPEWYQKGLISYLAEDWDVDIDNKVRDGILSGKYKKLKNLSGEDAAVAGHSLWRFIAKRYGKTTITNIIMMTGSSSNIKKGFLYVLGIPYDKLIKEWLDFYTNEYKQFVENKNEPRNSPRKIKYKEDVVVGEPHINPLGNILAYTTNERGKYKIFLYDLKRNKKHRIFRRGTMSNTKTDYSYPLLAWHPTGMLLSFVIERKGLVWLYMYNLKDKKFVRQRIYGVQKVTDMAYSDDGKFMVMSAVQKGKPDIFVFNIGAGSFDRITNDYYTDLNPRFINNSTKIIFSSNRLNDTLGIDMPDGMVEQPDNFDLFVYDYKTRNKVLKRITKTPLANELRPEEVDYNVISYLSDENGIYNAYMAAVDSAVVSVDTIVHYRYFVTNKVLTNYNRSIIDQHVSKNAHKKALIFYKDGFNRIYIDEVPDFDYAESVSLTMTNYMAQKKQDYEKLIAKIKSEQHKVDEKEKQEEQLKEAEDEWKRKLKRFSLVYVDDKGNEVIGKPKKEKVLKIDNNGQLIVVDDVQDEEEKLKIPVRRNYYTEYYIDNMVSQVDFTYLNYSYQPFTGRGGVINQYPGFNINFQIGVTDLMNDHRLLGGVRLNFSLINNEYFASYSNLKKRLDRELIFHRNTVEGQAGYNYLNIHTHELFYVLKWPFSEALSVRGTFHYRNDAYVSMATDMISLLTPTHYENWGGFVASLVYDDTRSLGLNLYRGWRWKIFAEYNQLLKKGMDNLIVFGFDFRNYLRIHRNFIWANRLAGSASMGNNKLLYYLGGVDNWIAPRYDHAPIDPREHYGFQTLATNLRGHYQNIRNGSNFILINSELRFPVFQYFSKAPISSGFVRNFQLVAFGDIGTAWSGLSPYAPFTYYVDGGPYHISVEVQKEPLVGGFGFGARAYLLGYFIRGDVAWGVEDGRLMERINKKGKLTKAPVFYFSLNLDF